MFGLILSRSESLQLKTIPFGSQQGWKTALVIGVPLRLFHSTTAAFNVSYAGSAEVSEEAVIRVVINDSGIISVERDPKFAAPVYYCCTHDTIEITTHIPWLQDRGRQLDYEGMVLQEFLLRGFVLPPATLYKGVSRLLLFHSLQIDGRHGAVRIRQTPIGGTFKKSNYRSSVPLLKRLIVSQLNKVHGEDVAVCFSGGLDSTILVQLAFGIGLRPRAVSADYYYDSVSDGECQYAHTAAEALRIKDYIHVRDSAQTFLNNIVHAIEAAQEPLLYMQSALIFGILSNPSLRRSKLFINGQGADALCGSEAVIKLYRRIRGRSRAIDGVTRLFESEYLRGSHWVFKSFGGSRHVLLDRISALLELLCEISNDALDQYSLFRLSSDVDITQGIWTKLAWSRGRAIVYPFTSSDVMSHIFRLPWTQKLVEPKIVLRELARTLGVSSFVIERPKLGFGPRSSKCWHDLDQLRPLSYEPFSRKILLEAASRADRKYVYWNMLNLIVCHAATFASKGRFPAPF